MFFSACFDLIRAKRRDRWKAKYQKLAQKRLGPDYRLSSLSLPELAKIMNFRIAGYSPELAIEFIFGVEYHG